MVADHQQQQRDGHVGVLARAPARHRDESGVRRRAVLDRRDDLLLRGPDAHPHVHHHRRAEERRPCG